MPDRNSPSALFAIERCPDLMADGCVCDEAGHLVFLSIWARDTAIQQFLARLTLGADEDGLDRLRLHSDQGDGTTVLVGNVDRLEKRSTHVYRRTLFGSIINLWLFDRLCIRPDKSNSTALALLRRDDESRHGRLWKLVQDTCPLPLLDHWRDTVMDLLAERSMVKRLPIAIGPLEGCRLDLDVPALTEAIGDLIRNGALGATPQQPAGTTETLRRAA